MKTILITSAAVLALVACGPTPNKVVTPTVAAPAAAQQTEPPEASQEPSGEVTGTCDYSLGTGLGNDYAFVAEVDAENTGGGGIVVAVLVTWPQFGRRPVAAAKKVRLAEGETKTVRFNKHATMAQISALQSWQQRHDFEDGCKYNGTIVDTF